MEALKVLRKKVPPTKLDNVRIRISQESKTWLKLLSAYGALVWGLDLVFESLMTYRLIQNRLSFQEIGEIVQQTKLVTVSIAGGLAYFLLRKLRIGHVIPALPRASHLFSSRSILALTFLRGATAPAIWALVMLFFHRYEFIGWFVDSSRNPSTILFHISRALFLVPWLWLEEILFRDLPERLGIMKDRFYQTLILSAFLNVLFRAFQFQLSLSQAANQFVMAAYFMWLRKQRQQSKTGFVLFLGFFVSLSCFLGFPKIGRAHV